MFARSRFSQNLVVYFVGLFEKMGKKQSLSTKERAKIVTLSNLKFSVRQIAKKMKVSKTAVHNAIMKNQNDGVFIVRKSSGRPRVTTNREDRLLRKAVTHYPTVTSKKIQAKCCFCTNWRSGLYKKQFNPSYLQNLASSRASQPENHT